MLSHQTAGALADLRGISTRSCHGAILSRNWPSDNPGTVQSPTVSLAHAARTAMMQAERDLIIPTLQRVRWNRRKAAPLLGVSYKTLLNKIKEHGIVQE